MGKYSEFKRMPLLMLPGDVPKKEKIAMLERDEKYLTRTAYCSEIDQAKRAKSFKKDFIKKANRKLRRKKIEEE